MRAIFAQITDQGSVLVDKAIKSGDIFSHDCWQELEPDAKSHTLHLIGLLSDGGVHSRIDQLLPLMEGVWLLPCYLSSTSKSSSLIMISLAPLTSYAAQSQAEPKDCESRM